MNKNHDHDAAFRELVDAASCMIVILRADHTVAYFNPFAATLTGYPINQVLGKDYFALLLEEEDQAGVDKELRRIFAGSEPTRGYEIAVTCIDGSHRWLAWNAQLLDDYQGQPAVIVVGHDVTTRKETNQHLEAILNTAVDGIITIDKRGIIQSFNSAAERIFGYTAMEAIGNNISMLMPAPYHDEHDGYITNYLRTREAKIIGIGREVVGKRKDGSTFPLDLAVSEMTLRKSRLFTGIVRDISDRKRAESRAGEFGRILDESFNEIYIFDATTLRFVQVNRGARDNLGYSMDELREMTPLDLENDFTAETFAAMLEPLRAGDAEKVDFETRHQRKDGTYYTVEVHLQMSTFELKPVFVAIILDVTQRKRAEERLLQAERLAAIGQTVTGLAHESRNAFQRSQACLEMLALDLEDRPDEMELVERIQRALDHLHHLYEEVRDYAAPIHLDKQVCNLARVWRDAWSQLEVVRKEKQIELLEENSEIDLSCEIDWFAFGQVFRNVMENAITACPNPGRIVIRCREIDGIDGSVIEVTVTDNGPGLGPDTRGKVFDAFFTTKAKGTGLGMAIARRIVEAHGGSIVVGDNDPGAEIRITVPRRLLPL